MKIRVIITGSTGMVGEGVLLVCLNSPEVESVLAVNRTPCGIEHPKLKEVVHKDFIDLTDIEDQLKGYNACYFCAGVSSVGKKEDEYRKITYDLTMNFARTLIKINGLTSLTMNKLDYANSSQTAGLPSGGESENKVDMVFIYVSGSGTDGTEKGRLAWARVKGKTENDLLKLPFKDAYMYRPGYIEPIKGQKRAYKIYKFFSPIYPLLEKVFPKYVGTMEELGNSMISVSLKGYSKKVLEVVDIRKTGR